MAQNDNPKHETSDVNLRLLGALLALLALGAFVVHAALWWMNAPLRATSSEDNPVQFTESEDTHFPRLQLSPQQDLQEFQAQEQQRLRGNSLHRTNALAVIPIERAMKILAQRGTNSPAPE